jgi:hypothetical protein
MDNNYGVCSFPEQFYPFALVPFYPGPLCDIPAFEAFGIQLLMSTLRPEGAPRGQSDEFEELWTAESGLHQHI